MEDREDSHGGFRREFSAHLLEEEKARTALKDIIGEVDKRVLGADTKLKLVMAGVGLIITITLTAAGWIVSELHDLARAQSAQSAPR